MKEEIVILEAKDMGITVSDEEVEESKQFMLPDSEASERFEMEENKEFYGTQASLLGVAPEDYYEVWEDKTYKRGAYLDRYFDTMFGEPVEEDDAKLWEQKINKHLDELFETYKENGKLTIK